MQEKTITITIDEQGHSTLDLEGFAGQKLREGLRRLPWRRHREMERKKASYYTGQQVQQEKSQR
jgi:hypothetical protein